MGSGHISSPQMPLPAPAGRQEAHGDHCGELSGRAHRGVGRAPKNFQANQPRCTPVREGRSGECWIDRAGNTTCIFWIKGPVTRPQGNAALQREAQHLLQRHKYSKARATSWHCTTTPPARSQGSQGVHNGPAYSIQPSVSAHQIQTHHLLSSFSQQVWDPGLSHHSLQMCLTLKRYFLQLSEVGHPKALGTFENLRSGGS